MLREPVIQTDCFKMPSDSNTKFLDAHGSIPTDIDNVVLFTAGFHVAEFSPELFSVNGIAMPPSIVKSVAKRRASFLAGRMLAARAFSCLQQPSAQIPIGPNREPIWPNGVIGSISHSADYCACILSTRMDVNVGVDIEAMLTPRAIAAVSKRVLTDTEKTWIDENNIDADVFFHTVVFSAKETIYKTLFPIVQNFFGFDAAEICAPPTQTNVQFRLTRDLHETLPAGLVLSVNYQLIANNILTWMVFDRP